MAGFIYIMSNPSFPDRIKIGKSKKDPTTDRVSELNQTGVPEPFKVEYYAFVEDEDYLEQRVHSYFNTKRPNKNREFFSVGCAEAIDTIRSLSDPYSKIKYEEVFYVDPEELEKLRQQREYQKELEEQARFAEAEEQRIKAEQEIKLEADRQRIEAEVAARRAEESDANRKLLSSILIFTAIGALVTGALGIIPFAAAAWAIAGIIVVLNIFFWSS